MFGVSTMNENTDRKTVPIPRMVDHGRCKREVNHPPPPLFTDTVCKVPLVGLQSSYCEARMALNACAPLTSRMFPKAPCLTTCEKNHEGESKETNRSPVKHPLSNPPRNPTNMETLYVFYLESP